MASKDLLLRWEESKEFLPPSILSESYGDERLHNLVTLPEGIPTLTPSPHGKIRKRVCGFFLNNEGRYYRIVDLQTIFNHEDYAEENLLDYGHEKIMYNTIKQALWQLNKLNILKKPQRGFYTLRDKDLAIEYIGGGGIPQRGVCPDSKDPLSQRLQNSGGEVPPQVRDKLQETPPGPLQKFHRGNLSARLSKSKFDELRSKCFLIPPKPKDPAKQWKFKGRFCKMMIPQKTRRSTIYVYADGWQEEIINYFGAEFFLQLYNERGSVEVAIDSSEPNLRFVTDDKLDDVEITHDNGSQLGAPETEIRGPPHKVATIKMMLLDPLTSMTKFDFMDTRLDVLATRQWDYWRDSTEQYLDVKKDLDKIKVHLSGLTEVLTTLPENMGKETVGLTQPANGFEDPPGGDTSYIQ